MLQELPCGHFMHSHCFAQYTRYNYTCPVCSKTMGDMSMYFRMIDSLVARSNDLPAGYACRKQVRLCFHAHLSTYPLACLLMPLCGMIACQESVVNSCHP